jgi:hypothetical protein
MSAYIISFIITMLICGGMIYAAIKDPSYRSREDCFPAEISPENVTKDKNES